MITEDYISFEIAKLLREKGFNESCTYVYRHDGEEDIWDADKEDIACQKPTTQMAMKWLREVHKIQIVVSPYNTLDKTWSYYTFRNFEALTQRFYAFETYEEAAEAAIKYCLENLI